MAKQSKKFVRESVGFTSSWRLKLLVLRQCRRIEIHKTSRARAMIAPYSWMFPARNYTTVVYKYMMHIDVHVDQ